MNNEIKSRRKKNVVQSKLFSEMLASAIRKYQNRALEAAQVIEELIELARQMRESAARVERLHLTDDEVVFYDALETNDSAVKVLGGRNPTDHQMDKFGQASALVRREVGS